MNNRPAITLAQIAKAVGGTIVGDPETRIASANTLDRAQTHEIAWIAAPKFASDLTTSKAGAFIVPQDCTLPPHANAVRVNDPDEAMCVAQDLLAPVSTQSPNGVHPSADIGKNVTLKGVAIGPYATIGDRTSIGAGTRIHAGVFIGEDVTVGKDCVLWPNVVIRERTTLGDRVIIHPNSTIGADGFGYLQRRGAHRKIPQTGTVIVEDDVEIGANAAVDRARFGVTRIGRGTKIDNLVQIGHNCDIGEHCIITGQCGLSGSVTLGRSVMIGGQSGIVDHMNIGDGVLIAAKSAPFKDVPAGSVVRGVPAIDNRKFLRREAAVNKLPDWIERVRALEKRIRELETDRTEE